MEPPRLKAAIRETLSDAPRSGSPGKFSAAQVCEILAVACELPGDSGRPISQWTREELRDEVIKRGLVDNISGCQIISGQFLSVCDLTC
jgi:putative transposase